MSSQTRKILFYWCLSVIIWQKKVKQMCSPYVIWLKTHTNIWKALLILRTIIDHICWQLDKSPDQSEDYSDVYLVDHHNNPHQLKHLILFLPNHSAGSPVDHHNGHPDHHYDHSDGYPDHPGDNLNQPGDNLNHPDDNHPKFHSIFLPS